MDQGTDQRYCILGAIVNLTQPPVAAPPLVKRAWWQRGWDLLRGRHRAATYKVNGDYDGAVTIWHKPCRMDVVEDIEDATQLHAAMWKHRWAGCPK